jgi:hypothetical protein
MFPLFRTVLVVLFLYLKCFINIMLYINFYSGTEHSYSGENDFPHTFNNRIYGPCTGKGGGEGKG